jgi:hypothetical protein
MNSVLRSIDKDRTMPKLTCLCLPALTLAAWVVSISDTGLLAQGLTLATDGQPPMTIVLAEDAISAERTAATELADYLAKITGGTFAVVGELAAPAGPRCYVGPTAFARKQGLDSATWDPADMIVHGLGPLVDP